MDTTIADGALYYPYVHFRDTNWLKANLIMFPFVQRMIPDGFLLNDDDEVKELANAGPRGMGLLREANLLCDRSIKAQTLLAAKLRNDSRNEQFLSKYGVEAAQKLKGNSRYGFQIHIGNLQDDLKEALLANGGLAWTPQHAEPYDLQHEYMEVHPAVGEAVMSTLAIACAQYSGLDIVGDGRSGVLHECLLQREPDKVYDTWLSMEDKAIIPQAKITGEELMECILGLPHDTSKLRDLSAKKILDLSEERTQINLLMQKLRERANQIRAVEDPGMREKHFKDATSDVLIAWERDRNNFAGFGRTFFGGDSAKMAADFAKKVAEGTVAGMATGAAGAAATAGTAAATGWIGTLAGSGVLVGAGAGLVIGLIVHAGATYHKRVKREKESPYQFLTTLKKEGIIFRAAHH